MVAVRDRHHVNIVLLHRLHNLGGVGAVPQYRQVIASNNRALGKARQVERGGAQPGGDHAPQRLVQVTPGDDVGDNKDAGERAASCTPPHQSLPQQPPHKRQGDNAQRVGNQHVQAGEFHLQEEGDNDDHAETVGGAPRDKPVLLCAEPQNPHTAGAVKLQEKPPHDDHDDI